MAADPAASDMDGPTYNKYVDFVNYYIHQVNLLRHLFGEPYRATYAEKSGVLLVARSASGVPGVIEMTPYETSTDWQESALVCFERGWIKIQLPSPLAFNRPGHVEVYRDPRQPTTRPRNDAELVERMRRADRMPDEPRPFPQLITPTLPWIHAMRQQAVNFCRAIRGEIKPPCDAQEALEDLKVAREYIRLSAGQ
jgi:predicted dehydrogenase